MHVCIHIICIYVNMYVCVRVSMYVISLYLHTCVYIYRLIVYVGICCIHVLCIDTDTCVWNNTYILCINVCIYVYTYTKYTSCTVRTYSCSLASLAGPGAIASQWHGALPFRGPDANGGGFARPPS